MRFFGAPLFGLILYIVAFFLVSDESFDEYYARYGGWAYLYDLLIAIAWSAINLEVSFLLSDWLDKLVPWTKKPVKRFLAQSSIQLSLTLIVVFACLLSYVYIFQLESWKNYEVSPILLPTFILAGLISLLVMGVNSGAYFLQRWQASQLEAEQLKQANLENQIQILTQQLDPHFLFNNFNTLASLIEENPKNANLFLSKMSDVYRYVLQTQNQKLASVKEELNVIDAYVYLLRQRFGESVIVSFNVSEESFLKMIPVLSLQNLVENAVKHNIVSSDQPLHVQIFTTISGLVVENNLQPKLNVEHSNKIGLKNIIDRYRLLNKESVLVEQKENSFRVTLPLLNPAA